MTVSELIDLLKGLPQDAPVAIPHYWDVDSDQLDTLSADEIGVENAAPAGEATYSSSRQEGARPVVRIG